MKLETKIKERGNRLIIVLSDLVVKRGGLNEGDVLEIELQDTAITIRNKLTKGALDKEGTECTEDVYSRILRQEELVLAK